MRSDAATRLTKIEEFEKQMSNIEIDRLLELVELEKKRREINAKYEKQEQELNQKIKDFLNNNEEVEKGQNFEIG